jgi:succinate dehydrogenase/fumarate reductase flavoprotein subunit
VPLAAVALVITGGTAGLSATICMTQPPPVAVPVAA